MEFCVFDLPVIYDQKREIPLDLRFLSIFFLLFLQKLKNMIDAF